MARPPSNSMRRTLPGATRSHRSTAIRTRRRRRQSLHRMIRSSTRLRARHSRESMRTRRVRSRATRVSTRGSCGIRASRMRSRTAITRSPTAREAMARSRSARSAQAISISPSQASRRSTTPRRMSRRMAIRHRRSAISAMSPSTSDQVPGKTSRQATATPWSALCMPIRMWRRTRARATSPTRSSSTAAS